MTIAQLNALDISEARDVFTQCCGSSKWIDRMTELRPFANLSELHQRAIEVWADTDEKDWFEAFMHHPKIGDINSLEKKYNSSKTIAENEQSQVTHADFEILNQLRDLNIEYENKFGFIFIVFASGKAAIEMLNLLKERIKNERSEELLLAKNEQEKITTHRINKLFDMITISSHILDTSSGHPAQDVKTSIFYMKNGVWEKIGQGVTNQDGRITDWGMADATLSQGDFKITFETKSYFDKNDIASFYPYVDIVFTISESNHYHIPLLINPFGYSTYRGS